MISCAVHYNSNHCSRLDNSDNFLHSTYNFYLNSFLRSIFSTSNYFVPFVKLLTSLIFSRLMTYIYIYIHIYIYICRTAPLTSRCYILYIYSTNTHIEYFKHAAYSPIFPLQNAVYFIMLSFLVPVLFTF